MSSFFSKLFNSFKLKKQESTLKTEKISYAQNYSYGMNYDLPLKLVSHQIDIYNGIAEVQLLQTYTNHSDQFLQLSYKFPVSYKSCLHKFVATFGKKIMEATVKEKEIARKQYTSAVKQGRKGAYGEISEDSGDVMCIQLGNIAPGQTVKLEIFYVEQLSISLNTFYSFSLLAKLTSRYINNLQEADFRNSFRKPFKNVYGEFQWDFKLRVRSTRKITTFRSDTHLLSIEKQNDQLTDLTFTLQQGNILKNNFSFIYTTEQFQLPSYSIGRADLTTTVMVSFVPKFCTLSLEDAKMASMQKYEVDMDSVRGEYIFLLDRSGSMEGQKIENAVKALILFLKSLPVDTYFNVVSFGSKHQFMFPNSIKNSNESIAKAIQLLTKVQANLGGTQISRPLFKILKSEVIEGYLKQIFILTDGQVSNTKKVIDLVKQNIKYSRVHTIGIGSGASQALIKGCAEKGKGCYTFIKNNQDPSAKIIQLLNDSLTPVISKVQLSYDKTLIQSVVPNPQTMSYILKNEVANFYLTFKGHLAQETIVQLSYVDSLNGLPYSSKMIITPQCQSQTFVDKMGNFRKIKILEQCEETKSRLQQFAYFVKQLNVRQQIIRLSVQSQILSKYTAFVSVQKELIDGKYQQIKQLGQHQIIIQPSKSIQPILREMQQCRMMDMCCALPDPQSQIMNSKLQDLIMQCQKTSCKSITTNIYQKDKLKQTNKQKSQQTIKKEQDQIDKLLRQLIDDDEELSETKPITIKDNTTNIQTSAVNSIDQLVPPIDNPIILLNQQKDISKQQNIKREKRLNLKKDKYSITDIVSQQHFEGFWDNINIIDYIFRKEVIQIITGKIDQIAIITFLITGWIQKYHPQPQYTLIVRKAYSWLKKQPSFSSYPAQYGKYIK